VTRPDLDAWLPGYAIHTRHRREAAASPDALWRAAEGVRLRDTRTLGRLVRWRIPGVPPETTFRDLFRTHPFTVLDEGDGWSLSGLAGRIWTVERDYPRLEDAAAFRDWDEPGTARVLMANWVEPLPGGRSALLSEARVAGTGRRADLRLRALWTVVGRFERLIGGEALGLAARRASSAGR
jgi:hypothetical protein